MWDQLLLSCHSRRHNLLYLHDLNTSASDATSLKNTSSRLNAATDTLNHQTDSSQLPSSQVLLSWHALWGSSGRLHIRSELLDIYSGCYDSYQQRVCHVIYVSPGSRWWLCSCNTSVVMSEDNSCSPSASSSWLMFWVGIRISEEKQHDKKRKKERKTRQSNTVDRLAEELYTVVLVRGLGVTATLAEGSVSWKDSNQYRDRMKVNILRLCNSTPGTILRGSRLK